MTLLLMGNGEAVVLLLSQIPGRSDWIEDGVDGKNREIQPTKIGVR